MSTLRKITVTLTFGISILLGLTFAEESNAMLSEELVEGEIRTCHVAYFSRVGYSILRCGYCDILEGKDGGTTTDECFYEMEEQD